MKNKVLALFLIFIICFGTLSGFAAGERSFTAQETFAKDLKELGLFHGVSDTDFALERPATRVEAVIMLVRLLGKSAEATEISRKHPFSDVPAWANNYIGYAYEKGLSYGTSSTTFGTDNTSAAMYLTFILRALGYVDGENGDFLWNDPFTLAERLGILPDGIDRNNFLRADVATVSYAALSAYIKGSEKTLAQKLIEESVFTKEKFDKKYDIGKLSLLADSNTLRVLSAEQIYEKCSSAVFYIEVFNLKSENTATGSGFFIDAYGTAITNYHVIDKAATAKITLSDTGETYDVLGVYDYSEEDDWAVIKVDISGNNFLEFGDESTVVGGSSVYAIGSPLGLQNTITEGIISNVNREVDGQRYIQISVPISHGSSGGALINKYGDVIGITSAGFEGGENLNLAIPVSVTNGYDNINLVTLGQLFYNFSSNTSGNNYIEAYDWLRAFIRTYRNETLDGCSAYVESSYTANGNIAYAIIEEDKNISVMIVEKYKSSNYISYLSIYENGDRPIMVYKYNPDGSYYFSGAEQFEPSIHTRGNSFVFSKYEGNADEQTNQSIAGDYLDKSLDFINDIFYKYILDFGYFTVKDLGFKNFN